MAAGGEGNKLKMEKNKVEKHSPKWTFEWNGLFPETAVGGL
jgi:hypothetical protein